MAILDWLNKKVDETKISKVHTVIGDIEDRLSFKTLAFYIATSYVADTISKCEFKVYNKHVPVKNDLYYLLNVSPNVNENASQFKNKLIFKLILNNEALVFEHQNKFYVADSFGTDKHVFKGHKYTNIGIDGETKTFDKWASDVFYFKLDDGSLKTFIDGMYDDYGKILSYAYNTYETSNSEKYKLVMSDVKVGDKEFNDNFEKVIKKQLQDFVNNPKSIYPQFKGYDLVNVSKADGKTDSSDIRNLRKDIFETVSEAFKMPVSMLYGNMTNVKDIISSYVTFRIDPLAKMISEEFTRKTTSSSEYFNGNYVDVDTTAITHNDIFDIAEKVDKMISSGVYCIDEIRDKLGENKLNTEFSKQHWITKNYSTVENALTGEGSTEGGE